MNMEEKITQGYLYDFYGELLNEHQRTIYEAFVFDDLSLSEIAEQEGITRQGVHDLVRRCTKTLENYESKLHLVEKFLRIRDQIRDIQSITSDTEGTDAAARLLTIQEISENILEEL